ncbi:hypothetical protein MJO28_004293 [Puccinia striiformis f. sp. tritici]|uniref:Uncharacterized protein n=1 Tax=Puccinia striiformis f. sp. tritici TaxID=168172 RepID=A0ACC0ENC3_9BASI|nr:hypothetical protein MJO28_004293 [Puccinia striiformis f. sp. tritici]
MQRVKFLIFSLFLSVPLVHAEGRLSRRQGGPSSGPPPAPPPRLFKCKTGETGYCNGGYLIENGITMSPAGNKGGNVWDGSIVGYSSATLACCNKNFYYTQVSQNNLPWFILARSMLTVSHQTIHLLKPKLSRTSPEVIKGTCTTPQL